MGSISYRQNKDGTTTVRVQYRINGRAVQESFGDPGKTASENDASARKFNELLAKHKGNEGEARKIWRSLEENTAGIPTLAEFTERYLDATSGLLTGIEPGTRAGYQRIAKASFLTVLGDYLVDRITKTDVGRWVAWQEAQPSGRNKGQMLAAKTVKNYHALLSSVLGAAVEQKLRHDNPAYRTRLSRGTKYEGTFLSADERMTLEYFIPERHKRFVFFLFGTGLRWGEATALTWGDLNLGTTPPTARITKAWKKAERGAPVLKHTKTLKSTRTVPLTDEVVAVLGEPQAGDKFVFPSETGGHLWYGAFNTRIWGRAVRDANDPEKCANAGLIPLGKRPTIHDTRHTHASMLLARGVPMNLVQSQMGHENITTTVGTYGHLAADQHVQLARVIAEAMSAELPLVMQKEIEAQPSPS